MGGIRLIDRIDQTKLCHGRRLRAPTVMDHRSNLISPNRVWGDGMGVRVFRPISEIPTGYGADW